MRGCQMYKWVSANHSLAGTLALDSSLTQEEVKYVVTVLHRLYVHIS